jgi:protein TonB
MDPALGRAHPVRRLTGLALVLLLHVAIVYALVTGLARRVIDVIRQPIEAKVIEEEKPKPPPPLLALPPPEFAAPPPPYIPPPEVKIAQPPPPPAIVAVTHTAPPAPVAITPAPPPPPAPVAVAAPAPPPPKPAPAPVTASVACSNYHTAMGDAAFPREALRRGIEHGDALIRFTLTADGHVTHVEAVHASNPVFAHASEAIVATFQCRGQGRDVVVQVPFDYRVE